MLCPPIPAYSFPDFISLKLATLLSVKHIRRFAQMITGGIITKLVFTDAQLVNSKIKRDYVTFVGFSTAAWLQWEGKIT